MTRTFSPERQQQGLHGVQWAQALQLEASLELHCLKAEMVRMHVHGFTFTLGALICKQFKPGDQAVAAEPTRGG